MPCASELPAELAYCDVTGCWELCRARILYRRSFTLEVLRGADVAQHALVRLSAPGGFVREHAADNATHEPVWLARDERAFSWNAPCVLALPEGDHHVLLAA